MRTDETCSAQDLLYDVFEHLGKPFFQVCIAPLSLEKAQHYDMLAQKSYRKALNYLQKALIRSASTGSAITVAAATFTNNIHAAVVTSTTNMNKTEIGSTATGGGSLFRKGRIPDCVKKRVVVIVDAHLKK
jgi:hypothetical protein